MNPKHLWSALLILLGASLGASQCRAQTITFSEDFTQANTANTWYYFNGACLTAGTTTSSSNPGLIPACTSVLASYYNLAANADPYLVGGYLGYLGSSTAPSGVSAQVADPVGNGALRFTNGSQNISGSEKYGHQERGAILSSGTFPTGAGLQVTFKTITYHGDSGGAGADGADGISFFLQDGSQPAGLGAWGGSLAYSCSNSNTPHEGLQGGYIGLGIDEYGNFLNGTNLVAGYTGSNTATGDNTPTATATSPTGSACAAPAISRGRGSMEPTETIRIIRPCPIIRSRCRHPVSMRVVPIARQPTIASTFAPRDPPGTPRRRCATRRAPAAPPTAARPIPATPARA